MKTLSVIPHEGIGSLKLGMSPEQILTALAELYAEFSIGNSGNIKIAQEKEEDGFTLRYFNNCVFFMVRYQGERAVEIGVDYEIQKYAEVTLYDKSVFTTLAEEMVAFLKQYSSCVYEWDDEDLSTNYVFPAIGVRLWREDAFHPKLLLDKKYMEEMKLVIDDMYHYLYFEIVAVL